MPMLAAAVTNRCSGVNLSEHCCDNYVQCSDIGDGILTLTLLAADNAGSQIWRRKTLTPLIDVRNFQRTRAAPDSALSTSIHSEIRGDKRVWCCVLACLQT